MSKRKTNDLHDIIDTAFVAADYSHGNGYYDKATDHNAIKRNRGFGQPHGNLQEPSKFGSASNSDSFRNDGGNIFLKNSQNNSNNPNSTNNEKSESNKIVLNDDNFPSLGSKSTKINNTQYKKFSYNQYSLYQEVKEKSEKIAHLKMVDDISSDDNVDDSYY